MLINNGSIYYDTVIEIQINVFYTSPNPYLSLLY